MAKDIFNTSITSINIKRIFNLIRDIIIDY